jgi:hypothetical protein
MSRCIIYRPKYEFSLGRKEDKMVFFEYREALEIVKEFYANAWADLKELCTIAFGVAVSVPSMVYIVKELIDKNIRKDIHNMKKEIKELQRDVSVSVGMSFFIQGNLLLEEFENYLNGKYGEIGEMEDIKLDTAIISYFKSLGYFIKIKDDKRFCTIINKLMDINNTFNLRKYLSYSEEYRSLLDDIIRKLRDKQDDDKYGEDIFFLENCYQYAGGNNSSDGIKDDKFKDGQIW